MRSARAPLFSPTTDNDGDRGQMMPRRRRTRAQTTATAIAAERRLNDPLVAERTKPHPSEQLTATTRRRTDATRRAHP
jgi:hypothetical protein